MVTTFLFAMGFGLVFPVLPFIVAKYVPVLSQQAVAMGWLGAIFALLTFFASPVLGALSDAYGRRPVLLLSLLISVVGYVIFGIGGSFWALLVGRMIDGICAGGMGACFAYVADVTPESERGASIGKIGAAMGAGFIVGPAVGGLAAHLSLSAPLFLAAGVALLNVLWGLFALPESLPKERRSRHFDASHLNPLSQLGAALAYPAVRRLVLVTVLFTLPFSLMQIALSLLARDSLHWGPGQVSTVFITVGLCDIIGQGFALPFLIKWLGERGVAMLGLGLGVLGMVGMALLPTLPSGPLVYLSTVCFAIGEGIFTATSAALIANATPAEAQGRVQGSAQGFTSLAQVAGPLGGGQVYARFGGGPTFGAGAALILAALALLAGSRSAAAAPKAAS